MVSDTGADIGGGGEGKGREGWVYGAGSSRGRGDGKDERGRMGADCKMTRGEEREVVGSIALVLTANM